MVMRVHRRRATRAAAAAVVALALTSPISLPAAARGPTCEGVPATIVGTPDRHRLAGTSGDDVIVTGGARRVDARSGNDLVCVTGRTQTVDLGNGDDRVLTDDVAMRTYLTLGGGADQVVGGARRDSVYAGDGAEQVSTGAGADSYDGPDSPGEGADDQVSLGPGPDRASLSQPNVGGVLDGGGGSNTLQLRGLLRATGQRPRLGGGQRRADRRRRRRAVVPVAGLRRLRSPGLRRQRHPRFRRKPADERVVVSQEFEYGVDIDALRMRGGDDEVELSGILGPVDAGAGDDRLRLTHFADERSGSYETGISIDLAAGWLSLAGGPAISVEGVDVSLGAFGSIVVRGDAHDNTIAVSSVCHARLVGLGGSDTLVGVGRPGCSPSTAPLRRPEYDGRPRRGRQRRAAWSRDARHRLIGGPGSDTARQAGRCRRVPRRGATALRA